MKKERYNRYTMYWTLPNGVPVHHTVIAVSKRHAFEKALGNPIVNMYLIDYMMDFEMKFHEGLFLWNIDGKMA